ncbi:MAG: hypothetical protein PUC39_09865, partial [Lachnospiraceae bacterium]|nr:hypothetical protein [Lachnospiraceae bacterium]
MKKFTRRDGKKREGYRQSERARYHIFRQQPNKEEEETGDGMMTLAVFFLCLSVVLILIQSVFYDTNRDFSFYQMSGVCWYLLRTATMLLVALIPFLVSYEQWAFFAAISLDVLSIVVVLLGGNGGFPATGGQWILVIGLFFSAVLLMVRHREFSRSLHYRFSSGTILGAVIFLLLQWSNTAYALHTIYMQSGEVVSVGTCYGKALCLWLPRG